MTKPKSGAAGATIAAGYPKALAAYAVSRGADRDALLRRAGIAAGALDAPDDRVALTQYIALFDAAAALCGDPAIALHFGQAVRMQEISIVGLICEAAETTAEVGRQLNRYAKLAVDANTGGDAPMVRTARDRDGLWMEAASEIYVRHPQMVEAELARLVWNTRIAFAGNPVFEAMPFPRAVQFTHGKPAHAAAYDAVFGAPVTFGAERNGILLDDAFPTLRQKPTNRYVFGILSERADALLKELEASHSTRGRVESLLIPILHSGDATMAHVAGKMGVSRQTLLRRLQAEGTNFEKLLDALRHKMAVHYLSGKKASINQVAYLVGFSEASAFSRAFKRWTGTSPRAMRGRS